jgi:hypothetical protein
VIPGRPPKVGSQAGGQPVVALSTSGAGSWIEGPAAAFTCAPASTLPWARAPAKAVTRSSVASSGSMTSSVKLPSAALIAWPPALLTITEPALGPPSGRSTCPLTASVRSPARAASVGDITASASSAPRRGREATGRTARRQRLIMFVPR